MRQKLLASEILLLPTNICFVLGYAVRCKNNLWMWAKFTIVKRKQYLQHIISSSPWDANRTKTKTNNRRSTQEAQLFSSRRCKGRRKTKETTNETAVTKNEKSCYLCLEAHYSKHKQFSERKTMQKRSSKCEIIMTKNKSILFGLKGKNAIPIHKQEYLVCFDYKYTSFFNWREKCIFYFQILL